MSILISANSLGNRFSYTHKVLKRSGVFSVFNCTSDTKHEINMVLIQHTMRCISIKLTICKSQTGGGGAMSVCEPTNQGFIGDFYIMAEKWLR